MNYQTYLFFEGRTEYIQGYDTPQHTYPLGSLMFGVLDLDAAPYLERGRTLLEKFRGVNFPENQTMQQSLATPDTCVYYQVASFTMTLPPLCGRLPLLCLILWRAIRWLPSVAMSGN